MFLHKSLPRLKIEKGVTFMKKAISVFSIISVVVAALSFTLFIGFLTVLWKPMCHIYVTSPDVVGAGPIIPMGTLIHMIGCLVVAIISCFFTKTNRVIVFEVIALALLILIIPVLTRSLTMVQSITVGQTMGEYYAAAFSIANQISTVPNALMAVAESLCLVVCGMSISEKLITKKYES